ncbi:hypothetical protein [Rubritalea sp.]|uniref:hypothetical protein n=1 Tax=Rubritalea sp. TaxID=2109375 RepID=UPI003EF63B06
MSFIAQPNTLDTLPKCWQIWKNPIFHRYRRSRLRLSSLITGLLLYGGSSIFFYLITLGISLTHVQHESMAETAIYPFGLIVFLQLFILNFVGTGEVASGMARESIDGVLTYQQLTPLSPATKIIGYLTGLPIRQFYHFLVTLPATFLVIQTGDIPTAIWGPIYTVLLTSTCMFYLLAMSVGLIMGKKFSALISQGLVALLYFALPQLSNFGFVIFEYLTIRPTIFSAAQKLSEFNITASHSALFFNWEVSNTIYCICIQGLLSWIFYSLLLRRWRNTDAHLLSKSQCIVITILLHIIILGSIWTNTSNGTIFNIDIQGLSPGAIVAREALASNKQYIAATILSLYGSIGFTAAILLQYVYTPDKFFYLAGLRNPNRPSSRLQNLRSDSGTGLPTSLCIALISTIAWLAYAYHMQQSPTVQAVTTNAAWLTAKPILILVAIIPLVVHALVLEYLGRQLTGIIAGFAWVLPLAFGILLNAWNVVENFAIFLYGFSPLAMNFTPGYIVTDNPVSKSNSAFIYGSEVGLIIYSLIGIIFTIQLIKRHRKFQKA